MISLLAIVLVGCLAWRVYRFPIWGVWGFWVSLLPQWLFGDLQPYLSLGGVQVYSSDAISTVLVMAASVRIMGRWSRQDYWKNLSLLGIGGLLLLNFANGIMVYGLKAAGLDFRAQFYVYAALFFGATFFDLPGVAKALRRSLPAVVITLAGLALFRWGLVALGMGDPAWAVSAERGTHFYVRVLNAGQAMLLAQAAIILASSQERDIGGLAKRVLPPLAVGMIILLQHRTVWVAMFLAMLVYAYRAPGVSKIFKSKFFWYGLGLSALFVVLFQVFVGNLFESLRATSEEAVNPTNSTMVWRFMGWMELLAPGNFTLGQWVVGKPFGTSYLRFLEGALTEVGAHSHYVAWILRTGCLGVAMWLALWKRAWKSARLAPVFTCLIVMQVAFGFSYPLLSDQGLILGWLLAQVGGLDPIPRVAGPDDKEKSFVENG